MIDWVPVCDIATHQGVANFAVMRAKGVRGLILRVAHGLTLDARVEQYYPQALVQGFGPDDIGFYPFLNPKRGSGSDTAEFAVEAILRITGRADFLYMIDVENYKEETPDKGSAPVFGPQFAAYIREHIDTVKALSPKSRVIGYTNRSYWNGKIYKGSSIEWVGDDALAGELDWIVARYPCYSDAAYANKPLPPDTSGWGEWAFKAAPDGPFPPRGADWKAWQFSAGFNKQGAAYGVSSTDLDLNIVHPDAWALWTGKTFPPPNPQPQPETDLMDIRLLTFTDSDAQFLAEATGAGRVLNCRWVGTAKLSAARDVHKAAAAADHRPFEYPFEIPWLANVALFGPLPTGDSKHTWSGQEFAAFDQAGTVDQVARDEANHANEAVTRIGRTISDIRMGGQRIADAGGT